ncbi:hypothetical protein [Modestobacter sp. SSW1-42]|uniref:hypothetical protein n=1 Tax=Modestobacter sp. SSW1-42 TaxID=596372 RepID=UPI0039873F16
MKRSAGDAERIQLGELAAQLDDRLNFVLALHLGRGPDEVLALINDVLWRVPIADRIAQLDAALTRAQIKDAVPALPAALTAVFAIRNLLAHSVSYGSTDEAIELWSVRNGKRQTRVLTRDHLRWTVDMAELCLLLWLPRIEGRVGDVETWGWLYRYDEP